MNPLTTCSALLLLVPAAVDDETPVVRQPPPPQDVIDQLPPDGGDEFNRLVFEKSPYLLQHARNPVDWWPWGEAAFAAAKEADKPIFLSIGYSTCHWCHVMEHESFEDAEVAALMNDAFICVKVDREERPDVDQVYMTVTQGMTGSGGWPMTVVMTPEKKPFYAGTYFPKRGRGGRPGMMELVPALADMWANRRDEIQSSADEITAWLAGRTASVAGEALGEATCAAAFDQFVSAYDSRWGGFGHERKFPVPHNLRFLLRWSRRTGDPRGTEMVAHTLRMMRLGGIWDHVGHGIHRYSTDPKWFLPHFEKMLYDQALVSMAAIEAWQVTGDDGLREMAELIFEYVLRDMTSPDGGFYSAEDADSEGEEGLFYIWSREELHAVLGAQEAALWERVYGVEEKGNFFDEATRRKNGLNVFFLEKPLAETAAELDMELSDLRSRLEASRRTLFDVREKRIHPLKDDKILTDWNGLMIAAFSLGARAFDEGTYADAARSAAEFVLRELRTDDGRLMKRWREGEAAFPAVIDDYAFLCWGLVELYQATGEARWIAEARALADGMVEHFWDEEHGGFFIGADDGEALLVRSKEVYDGATPSGNSAATYALVQLARILGAPAYEERAVAVTEAFAGNVAQSPMSHAQLLMAVDFLLGPTFEVVIAGATDAEDVQAMRRALFDGFRPNLVTVLRPDEDEPPIARLAPYTREQRALDGAATAYVCRDFACKAPTTSVEQMLRNLDVPDER